jgi:hypothetical protein
VREDIIFVKDGNVMEFNSVKEYLDSFRTHLELVKLKRLIRDNDNNNSELEFLEAKVLFMQFMMDKKRKNEEIVKFLSDYNTKISSRLQRIEIVKLSQDHLKETKDQIDAMKKEIKIINKKIENQEKVYKEMIKKGPDSKLNTRKIQNTLFSSNDQNGIEIYQVEEEEFEEEKEIEEFDN